MNPTEGAAPLPDIKDIAGPETLPSLWEMVALIGGIVIGLLLLGALIYFLYRTLTRTRKIAAPPLTVARRRLDSLAEVIDVLDANAFSQGLSESLKNYLTDRFGDPIRSETTEEFLRRLSEARANTLPTSLREKVATFLSVSDEIKYGRSSDAARHKLPLLELAREVLACEPEPEPSPAGGRPAAPRKSTGRKRRRSLPQ